MSIQDLREDYGKAWDLDEIEISMDSKLREMGAILSGGDFEKADLFKNYTRSYFLLREAAMEKGMEDEKLKRYDSTYLNNIEKSVKELK